MRTPGGLRLLPNKVHRWAKEAVEYIADTLPYAMTRTHSDYAEVGVMTGPLSLGDIDCGQVGIITAWNVMRSTPIWMKEAIMATRRVRSSRCVWLDPWCPTPRGSEHR